MQKLSSFLVVMSAVALLGGCAGSQPRETAMTTTTPRTRTVVRLRLQADVRVACAELQAPTLEFDSGDAEPSHREAFRPLANCMNRLSNQPRRFLLVGHTDPVGTSGDNAQLGMDRANAVRAVLVSFGVAGDRLDVTSRGETDASGTTHDEWPAARRVEIEFAPAASGGSK